MASGIFWPNRARKIPLKEIGVSLDQIIKILKEAKNGISVPGLCRQYDFSKSTITSGVPNAAPWIPPALKRLKQLEEVNHQLKQMYAELSPDHKILTDIIAKKFKA